MADEAAGGLPHSLERVWARDARAADGGRPALSPERIAESAIELVDAEGLGALSMAKLAQRLGSATMSLYRHVESKEELQVFMVDAAVGTPPPLDGPVTDWQTGLLTWARSLIAVYRQHPWILQIQVSGPPMTPAQLAWLEHGLRVQEGLRLEPGEKLNVALTIIGYVRGEAAIATGMESVTADENPPAQYGKLLAALIDQDRFPRPGRADRGRRVRRSRRCGPAGRGHPIRVRPALSRPRCDIGVRLTKAVENTSLHVVRQIRWTFSSTGS